MFFEVWTNAAPPLRSRKLVQTNSWPLANFFARIVSLTGDSMIICDQCFDGDKPGEKTLVADYHLGRLSHFFAGAPSVPSMWP